MPDSFPNTTTSFCSEYIRSGCEDTLGQRAIFTLLTCLFVLTFCGVFLPISEVYAIDQKICKNSEAVFKLQGPSMQPILDPDQLIKVKCFSHSLIGSPRDGEDLEATDFVPSLDYGQIILFIVPIADTKTYSSVKRIVGLPKDKIQFRNGDLFVNGKSVDGSIQGASALKKEDDKTVKIFYRVETAPNGQQYKISVKEPEERDPSMNDTPVFAVPPKSVFVLGDFRDGSADGRIWGTVPYANLVGTVIGTIDPSQSVVPHLNVQSLCDSSATDAESLLRCLNNQQGAYDQLKEFWAFIDENIRTTCSTTNQKVFSGKTVDPGYPAMLTCISESVAKAEKETKMKNLQNNFKFKY